MPHHPTAPSKIASRFFTCAPAVVRRASLQKRIRRRPRAHAGCRERRDWYRGRGARARYRGIRSALAVEDGERKCDVRAATRLADALAAGEPIAVYGDYDVDGITGAAQLVLCLRELGAEPLLHVSHRGREGYGLHVDALDRLRAAGARVVVTADCGTADEAALAHAADTGLDVIVCDHHHAPTRRQRARRGCVRRNPRRQAPPELRRGVGLPCA